jgi:rhamnosyltransferase
MTGEQAAIKVAGMVTLYNSERSVLQRIRTYIHQVDVVYAVDNSEEVDNDLINSILVMYPTVRYINNGGNKGIAYALNIAAKAAIDDQFEYLLMMDDDSETPANLVSVLSDVFRKRDNLGIVSAQSDYSVQRDDEQEVNTTITSGSLLNLRAYKAVGPFLDALFIDWVDHEYCFRLAAHNYGIVVVNQLKLNHRLGIFREKRLFNHVFIRWRSHNPKRLYYKFRNSLYVMNQYGRQLQLPFMMSVYYELFRDFLKILFVEDDKRLYMSLVTRGIQDAYRKKLGKLLE